MAPFGAQIGGLSVAVPFMMTISGKHTFTHAMGSRWACFCSLGDWVALTVNCSLLKTTETNDLKQQHELWTQQQAIRIISVAKYGLLQPPL